MVCELKGQRSKLGLGRVEQCGNGFELFECLLDNAVTDSDVH